MNLFAKGRSTGGWAAALVVLLVFTQALSLFAQPKSQLRPPPPLNAIEGAKQARALVSNLLAQRPSQNYTNTEVVRVRAEKKPQQEIPVRFVLICTPTNYLNLYEVTGSAKGISGTTLTIVHNESQPNEYFLSEPGATGTSNAQKRLTSAEMNLPFAGSDFWVCDLGLEFLHWPQQRIVQKEMRKNLFCDVLESTNPNPTPGNYSRVVTWIAANRPDETVIVHGDAYDLHNKLLKEFDPKKVEKVNGVYQLEEMEIRNIQTHSRTRIEFNLDQ